MSMRSLIAAGSACRVKRGNTMAKRSLVGTVVVAIALMVIAAFPTAGFGVTTIGSDLAAGANASYAESPAIPPGTVFTVMQDLLPGRPVTSPINGVIVRWRIKTNGAPPFSPFTLRVIGVPGTGVATGPQGTPAAGTIVNTFDARLPIAAGQLIGLDLKPAPTPDTAFYLNSSVPGALTAVWVPALANGQVRVADPDPATEVLVNADIEPDADGDAFGDETQDRCKTDPFPAGGACTPPTVKLGGKKTQRALKQKGVLVEVTCPTEQCTANAKGTVAVPGAAKVFKLRPATKKIAAGGKAKLKLKFAKKTLKAVKRALAKRKKLKAKLTVTANDVGGNSTTKKQTVRLKR